MGALIAWNVVSADGFFEGVDPWDLSHHEYIWGEDLRRLSLDIGREAGLLVFGRNTYEGMAAHWPTDTTEPEIADYMNSIAKLVASRTLTEASWQNTEVTANIVDELRRRKRADDRPIYVFGSATLTHSLLEAGLVDQVLLGIAPVLLGAGTPLFKGAHGPRGLTLIESRTVDTGGVLIRYGVPRGSEEDDQAG
ncbi:dihydrofolate reductase family protein [Pseudactinotalea sp. Z1732]|uniref:dihydrofolate reductase family protein n=1 Tax=Micrococcales TaxID=85006 RepID=UPI003C79AC6D